MKLGIDCHHIEDQEGIKRYTLALLKTWERLGYLESQEHQVICYFKRRLPEIVELPNRVQIAITDSPSTFLFEHIRLPLEAWRDGIDVLFSPSYLLPFFYRGKSVLTMHDIVFSVLPDDFDWPFAFDKYYLPYAARHSATKATFILTPSEFTKKEIKKRWRINPSKIFVTPFGGNIDLTKKQPLLARGDFVLFVGSIFNRRHVAQLIDAFYTIIKTQPTIRLIIVGKDRTSPSQYIDRAIQKANYNMKRQVIVRKDWVSDEELIRLYYSAKALVLLSDYEGFGLPVLEALSCGLPVLTTKKGSIPEIAGDATVYVSNPTDVREIASKLLTLLTNTGLRKSLKAKGLKQAQKFNWSATAKQTWDLLELASRV